MPTIALAIGNRTYEIACRDGEEAHFQRIAAIVDARAGDAARAVGGLTETRTLLFAALLLADEVSGTPAPPAAEPDPAVAQAIERLAIRMEALAERLETGTTSA